MEADERIPLPATSKPPAILLDTLLLLFLRVVYFLLARRFLLHTLNPTLRDLSKAESEPPETLPTVSPGAAAASSASSRQAVNLSSDPSSPSRTAAPASDFELDYSEDDYGATPSSSYPPSPAGGHVLNSRRDYLGGGGSPSSSRASLPATPVGTGSGNALELQTLGHKLQTARDSSRQVLQLSHGRSSGATVGAKGVKKATRGLNKVSRYLFGFCFAEGCNLLTLVIFHALGILHSRSRHVNFSISLHVVLALVLLIVPLVQCLLLTYRSRESSSATHTTSSSRTSSLPLSSRLLISLIPFTLYIFLFTRIPPYITALPRPMLVAPEPGEAEEVTGEGSGTLDEALVKWTTSGPEGWEGEGWLAPSLGRLIVLGVVVLGVLSGFGAVRTAWSFFEHASGVAGRSLTDNDLLQAERSLYRVRHDLVAKREELSRITVPSTPGGGSWMGRVFGSKEDQEVASVRAELSGLKAMERQVSRSLTAMKIRKRSQDFGHTLRGQIYNILGYIFAIYCSARLVMCLPSIFFTPAPASVDGDEYQPPSKGNTNGDWISFLLALGLSHLPTGSVDIDVAVWSRGISLLLTGLLILSSLAQVLRSLMRVLKLTSKTVGAGFLLLSLGQLFATYVISLLVQLRTSLPPSPAIDTDPFSPFYSNTTLLDTASLEHDAEDSLLSSLPDFRVFGRLFDVMFFLAAVGTAVYRYVERKVNAADDMGEVYRS